VQQRSRSVIGYWLVDCLTSPDELVREPLGELFELVRTGVVSPVVGASYPLSDAARAHGDLEARRTTGKLVLQP